jgi:hypothetical protein
MAGCKHGRLLVEFSSMSQTTGFLCPHVGERRQAIYLTSRCKDSNPTHEGSFGVPILLKDPASKYDDIEDQKLTHEF